MGTVVKIWLIIAASLILLGCIIFGGVMTGLKWDFSKLSMAKYETNNYEINEEYTDISILTDTADIVFVSSKSQKSSIKLCEQTKAKHSVSVKDGTLVIEMVDSRKWYEYIGIDLGTQSITVCIPEGKYGALLIEGDTGNVKISEEFKFKSIDICQETGDVSNYASVDNGIKIKTTTGDISVKNVSSRSLELYVSTGKVNISDVNCDGNINIGLSTGKAYLNDASCKKLMSSGSTGDIFLTNVVAEEKISIKRSTGDVKFDSCDSKEILVNTNTGSVKGSLLSGKIFITKTSTGDISVPEASSGGKCKITTSTGDISITIK